MINCGEEQNDLWQSATQNKYNTTEKLINTDEQCEFRPGERFPPLTDHELEEELRQFSTKFEWKDVLGKSFDVPLPFHRTDNTVDYFLTVISKLFTLFARHLSVIHYRLKNLNKNPYQLKN